MIFKIKIDRDNIPNTSEDKKSKTQDKEKKLNKYQDNYLTYQKDDICTLHSRAIGI